MAVPLVLLGAFWAVWCAVHSVLIADGLTVWAQRTLGPAYRYYRLAYNGFSAVTFALVYWYYLGLHTHVLFAWTWPWNIAQAVGLTAGLLILWGGARKYNQRYFFGLQQISAPETAQSAPPLSRDGILGAVRHPYYSGGILILLFFGDITVAWLVMRFVLIAYLIIGTFVEERKLLRIYGDRYRSYMKDVPRFFPRLFSSGR